MIEDADGLHGFEVYMFDGNNLRLASETIDARRASGPQPKAFSVDLAYLFAKALAGWPRLRILPSRVGHGRKARRQDRPRRVSVRSESLRFHYF